MKILTEQDAIAACMGGGVFACGGGGWWDHGLQNGKLAVTLGRPRLCDIDEIPQDGYIVTISAIGAPASDDFEMWPKDYIRAYELVRDAIEHSTGKRVVGVMNAQNGFSSSVNCWMPAAAHDLPVVDAAGDVRAHPTVKLGAMGYAGQHGFQTVQAVVGGKRAAGAYLEVVTRGNLFKTANILRAASVEAGGFIASARLPLPVSEVRQRAALGSISWAINLGTAMLEAQHHGGDAVIQTVMRTTGGRYLVRGAVAKAMVTTAGGFDHGTYVVRTGTDELTLYLLNEFMAAEQMGQRVATFPDTITVMDSETGMPLKSAELVIGREVAVLVVPCTRLPMGKGVLDRSAYPELERIMGIDFTQYLPGE